MTAHSEDCAGLALTVLLDISRLPGSASLSYKVLRLPPSDISHFSEPLFNNIKRRHILQSRLEKYTKRGAED